MSFQMPEGLPVDKLHGFVTALLAGLDLYYFFPLYLHVLWTQRVYVVESYIAQTQLVREAEGQLSSSANSLTFFSFSPSFSSFSSFTE
jgi:hypothetical protein